MRVIRRTKRYHIVDFCDGSRGAITMGGTFHVTAYDWPRIALHYRSDRQGD